MITFQSQHREEALCNALKQLRKEAGLKQEDLAERIGKPQSFVSKYERGERKLKYVELELICHACDTTLSAFASAFSRKYPSSAER